MVLVALCLLVGIDSIAEGQMMIPGTIQAGAGIPVSAPFGGVVGDIDIQKGDYVSGTDILFTIETNKVYAPCDGMVGTAGLAIGDDAAFVQERYGALLTITPENYLIIKTDTKNAYKPSPEDDKNQLLHIGEAVYIGSKVSGERMGTGVIIAVDDTDYTVEVTSGNLLLDESVAIYRDANFDYATRIGSGKTERNADVFITAEGSIYRCHVNQGDVVKRGDMLLEMVEGSVQDEFPSNGVVAGQDAIIASIDVQAGASVSTGQCLATLYPLVDFRVVVLAYEQDLAHISLGMPVQIEMASIDGAMPFAGQVVGISGLSSNDDADDPAYAVGIQFKTDQIIRQGMNVNVYFDKQ